jgi:hypothetical protein
VSPKTATRLSASRAESAICAPMTPVFLRAVTLRGVLAGSHTPRASCRAGDHAASAWYRVNRPRLRLRRPGSARGNDGSRHEQAQPKKRSQLSWLRTEDMAHLPELGAALSQRRPPDRAQAQGQAADRHARASRPSDIERRPAQTAPWQETAPASPTGLSPGSEPSTTTEPRDISKPSAKTGHAASSRPLPDAGEILWMLRNCPSICPSEQRGPRFYARNKPLNWSPLRNRTVDLLLTMNNRAVL